MTQGTTFGTLFQAVLPRPKVRPPGASVGTGLGLTICKQLTELMHGSDQRGQATPGVRVDLPGLVLPVAQSTPGRAEDGNAPVRRARGRVPVVRAVRLLPSPGARGRILIVEDNELNQKVHDASGARLRATTRTWPSTAARAWSAGATGNYALILSDLHMPELDGYDLARRIRHAENGNPALCRSSRSPPTRSEARSKLCFTAGMDDCLTKPVRLPALKAMLQRWIPE